MTVFFADTLEFKEIPVSEICKEVCFDADPSEFGMDVTNAKGLVEALAPLTYKDFRIEGERIYNKSGKECALFLERNKIVTIEAILFRFSL